MGWSKAPTRIATSINEFKTSLKIAMSTRSPCFTERGIFICLKQLSSGRLGGFRSLANPRVGAGLWFCQIGKGDRTPFGGVNMCQPRKIQWIYIEIAAFFFNGTKLSHTHTTKWVPLDKRDFSPAFLGNQFQTWRVTGLCTLEVKRHLWDVSFPFWFFVMSWNHRNSSHWLCAVSTVGF